MPETRPRLRPISWLLSAQRLSDIDSARRKFRHRSLSLRFSRPRSSPHDAEAPAAPSPPRPPTEDELWAAAETWVAKQVLVTFRHRAIVSQLRPVYAGVKSIDPGDLMLQIILPPKLERCAPRFCSSVSTGNCCAVIDHDQSHVSVVDECRSVKVDHGASQGDLSARWGEREGNGADCCKVDILDDRPRREVESDAFQDVVDPEMSSIEELKLFVRERLAHFDAVQNIVEPEVAVRRWNQPTKMWAHRVPFRKLNGQEFDRAMFSQCSQPGSDSITF